MAHGLLNAGASAGPWSFLQGEAWPDYNLSMLHLLFSFIVLLHDLWLSADKHGNSPARLTCIKMIPVMEWMIDLSGWGKVC